jgi:hypothetical protein
MGDSQLAGAVRNEGSNSLAPVLRNWLSHTAQAHQFSASHVAIDGLFNQVGNVL